MWRFCFKCRRARNMKRGTERCTVCKKIVWEAIAAHNDEPLRTNRNTYAQLMKHRPEEKVKAQ